MIAPKPRAACCPPPTRSPVAVKAVEICVLQDGAEGEEIPGRHHRRKLLLDATQHRCQLALENVHGAVKPSSWLLSWAGCETTYSFITDILTDVLMLPRAARLLAGPCAPRATPHRLHGTELVAAIVRPRGDARGQVLWCSPAETLATLPPPFPVLARAPRRWARPFSSSAGGAEGDQGMSGEASGVSGGGEASPATAAMSTADTPAAGQPAGQLPGTYRGADRKLAIVFTCTVCDTRLARQIGSQAYESGVVRAKERCPITTLHLKFNLHGSACCCC